MTDQIEELRLWIWEKIDKHGEDLVATQPAFDLILNKIDEIKAKHEPKPLVRPGLTGCPHCGHRHPPDGVCV